MTTTRHASSADVDIKKCHFTFFFRTVILSDAGAVVVVVVFIIACLFTSLSITESIIHFLSRMFLDASHQSKTCLRQSSCLSFAYPAELN